MNRCTLNVVFVVLTGIYVSASAMPTFAQTPISPDRASSEKAIRVAVYENAMAAQSGDVKLYRKHIAKRTMEFHKLVYQGFKELPDFSEALTEKGLDTVDKYIDSTFVSGASQYANLTPEKKEENARAQSAGQIIFLADKEAVVKIGNSSLRLVWEDNEWKIDETEEGKKMFLENFPFTPATREKIEKL